MQVTSSQTGRHYCIVKGCYEPAYCNSNYCEKHKCYHWNCNSRAKEGWRYCEWHVRDGRIMKSTCMVIEPTNVKPEEYGTLTCVLCRCAYGECPNPANLRTGYCDYHYNYLQQRQHDNSCCIV